MMIFEHMQDCIFKDANNHRDVSPWRADVDACLMLS